MWVALAVKYLVMIMMLVPVIRVVQLLDVLMKILIAMMIMIAPSILVTHTLDVLTVIRIVMTTMSALMMGVIWIQDVGIIL
jgi:hypothetical protein